MKPKNFQLLKTPSSQAISLVYDPSGDCIIGICGYSNSAKNNSDEIKVDDFTGLKLALEEERLQSILHVRLMLFILIKNQLVQITLNEKIRKAAAKLHNQHIQAMNSQKAEEKIKNENLLVLSQRIIAKTSASSVLFQNDLFFYLISFLNARDKIRWEQTNKKFYEFMNNPSNTKKVWNPINVVYKGMVITKIETKNDHILYAHIMKQEVLAPTSTFTESIITVATFSSRHAYTVMHSTFNFPNIGQKYITKPLPDNRSCFTKAVSALWNMFSLLNLFMTTIAIIFFLIGISINLLCLGKLITPDMRLSQVVLRSLLGLSIYPIIAIIGSMSLGAYYGWKFGHVTPHRDRYSLPEKGIEDFILRLFVGFENESWDEPFKIHHPFKNTIKLFEKATGCTMAQYAATYTPTPNHHLPKILSPSR